jgi:hypothetical protein
MEMHISRVGRDGWTSYPTSAGLEDIALCRDMTELVEVWACNSKFTGVQHLDIFEVLIEVATMVEATTTTEQSVIIAVGQWQLGHCRQSWGGDVFPCSRQIGRTQLWVEAVWMVA